MTALESDTRVAKYDIADVAKFNNLWRWNILVLVYEFVNHNLIVKTHTNINNKY